LIFSVCSVASLFKSSSLCPPRDLESDNSAPSSSLPPKLFRAHRFDDQLAALRSPRVDRTRHSWRPL